MCPGRSVPSSELYLFESGVGVDVHEAAMPSLVRVRQRAAAQVQYHVRVFEQLLNRGLPLPEPPIRQTVVIGPGVGQAELPKGVPQKPNVLARGLNDGYASRRIRRCPVVLHVIALVAQSAQSQKMVQD